MLNDYIHTCLRLKGADFRVHLYVGGHSETSLSKNRGGAQFHGVDTDCLGVTAQFDGLCLPCY